MRVTIVKMLIVVGLVCGAPINAHAVPMSFFKIADEWGTIQPAGPRSGTSGIRFVNAQGADNGANASTAPFRFYMADIKSQADSAFGEGQWQVTKANIVLSQNNAFFTAAGPMNLFWFENDSLPITNNESEGNPGSFTGLGLSPLRFQAGANAFDTVHSDGTTDATAIFGAHSIVDSFQFTSTGQSGDWPLDVLAPFENGDHVLVNPEDPGIISALPNYAISAPLQPAQNQSRPFRWDTLDNFDAYAERVNSNLDVSTIAADIENGADALSLMLVAATASGSATYKGNPNGGDYPFRLYLEIDQVTSPPVLDGDHNGDGSVDAADYVLWRKDPATYGGEPSGYNQWLSNFGAVSGQAGGGSANNVPEPATAALLALGLFALQPRRRTL